MPGKALFVSKAPEEEETGGPLREGRDPSWEKRSATGPGADPWATRLLGLNGQNTQPEKPTPQVPACFTSEVGWVAGRDRAVTFSPCISRQATSLFLACDPNCKKRS